MAKKQTTKEKQAKERLSISDLEGIKTIKYEDLTEDEKKNAKSTE